MLSLAGSLLVEISLPKVIAAWTLLLVVPGLLLGLTPIVVTSWLSTVSDNWAMSFWTRLAAARLSYKKPLSRLVGLARLI